MKKVFLTLLKLLLVAIAFSQTNFSGTWIFKDKQMITGPEYANALPKQIKVDQQRDSILIESISVGGNGNDVTSKQTIAMNGRESAAVSAMNKIKYTKSLAWSSDKKTLTITTIFSMPENENEVDFTRVEIWIIANGKLNIDKKSIETRSETWEIKGVFEKVNGQ